MCILVHRFSRNLIQSKMFITHQTKQKQNKKKYQTKQDYQIINHFFQQKINKNIVLFNLRNPQKNR
mgnify:CR=1 FL=1